MSLTPSGSFYDNIQSAYDVANDGSVILSQATDSTENLFFNRPLIVSLDGGKSSDFRQTIGMTSISGILTIVKGTVTVTSIIIH